MFYSCCYNTMISNGFDCCLLFIANRVAIESSSNTFLEELHRSGDLTWPIIVSDNDEDRNFVWRRNSGIRVYVGAKGKLNFLIWSICKRRHTRAYAMLIIQFCSVHRTCLYEYIFNWCSRSHPLIFISVDEL